MPTIPTNNAPLSDKLSAMSSNSPIVLFPVRLECKIVNYEKLTGTVVGNTPLTEKRNELWVRIFPDTISVNSFQEQLKKEEIKAGKEFWQKFDSLSDNKDKMELWAAFKAKYRKGRSKYIVLKTCPRNSDPNDLSFSFNETLNAQIQPQAPKANAFPDRFALLMRFSETDSLKHIETGNQINRNIKLGPDPVILDSSLGTAANDPARHDIKLVAGKVVYEDGLKWISDFDEAIRVGLGFKIDLKEKGMPANLKRIKQIMVLGLRFEGSKESHMSEVDQLLKAHQYSYQDLSLLPNGAATNNTENNASFVEDDLEAEFKQIFKTQLSPTPPAMDTFAASDVDRLNSVLHLDRRSLAKITDRKDISEAKAMNTCLWPATWGNYFTEFFGDTMSLSNRKNIKDFALEFVSARGHLPNIRIGSQPYGFLVTSDFRNWKNTSDTKTEETLLYTILKSLQTDWDRKLTAVSSLSETLPDDPELRNSKLMDILKNHPSAIAFEKIVAVDKDVIENCLELFGTTISYNDNTYSDRLRTIYNQITQTTAGNLGQLTDLAFLALEANPVNSKTVSTLPLSETTGLESPNYISWLRSLKTTSELMLENLAPGISSSKTLLYQFLRISYINYLNEKTTDLLVEKAGVNADIMRSSPVVNVDIKRMTKTDFLNFKIKSIVPFSASEKVSPSLTAGNYALTRTKTSDYYYALELIENLPTARLERLFAEHIDICTYRLDAWQSGFFNKRLRQQQANGYYVGAYGWLENLDIPEPGVQAQKIHGDNLVTYSSNSGKNNGFIHSYSIAQANTAAVLYNAFLSHKQSGASDAENTFTMNLSSGKVHQVQEFIQGLRNGQSLAALLGYKLESFLLDSPNTYFTVAQHLKILREKFPINENPQVIQGQAEKSEQQPVINGLKFYNKVKEKANLGPLVNKVLLETRTLYPYTVVELPAIGTAESGFIIDAVNKFFDFINSIEDLMISESVFQQVNGNLEKSGSVLNQITQAENLLDPEILKSPRSGKTFTNRMAILFDPPELVKYPYWDTKTPRSQAEKSVNAWLGAIIGNPKNIWCYVYINEKESSVCFAELQLEPLDLVLMSDNVNELEQSELGRWISYILKRQWNSGDEITIRFAADQRSEKWGEEIYTWAEIASLLAQLRKLISQARPMHNADFSTATFKGDLSTHFILEDYWMPNGNGRLNQVLSSFIKQSEELNALLGKPIVPLDIKTAALINSALENMARFGHPQAVPQYFYFAQEIDKELSAAEYNKQIEERTLRSKNILEQANSVQLMIQNKIEVCNAILKNVPTTLKTEEQIQQALESLDSASKLICGDSFRLIPRFNLQEPVKKAENFDYEKILTQFNYGKNFVGSAKFLMGDTECSLVINQWIQSTARIKAPISTVEQIQHYCESMGTSLPRFHVAQFPLSANPKADNWVAVEFPEKYEISGDKLSLVCSYSDLTYKNMLGNPKMMSLSGLILDEWTESVPNKKETSAVAFHYNKPNSMPPQAVLIAVSPEIGTESPNWKWENLLGVLDDTIQRAKRRAVGPDEMKNPNGFQLDSFLPSVFLPFVVNTPTSLTNVDL